MRPGVRAACCRPGGNCGRNNRVPRPHACPRQNFPFAAPRLTFHWAARNQIASRVIEVEVFEFTCPETALLSRPLFYRNCHWP
jgi:hypothetical protein